MSTDPKTYSGDSWQSGGAMVWTTPAIDPQLGLVIFSTGNPNPDLDGTIRARATTCTATSIVALDVHTGKLKWYYQEVKHDVWDYDAVSNVVLFDVHQNGETIPAAGEAGKVGWVFIVDRAHGQADPQIRSVRDDVEEHVQHARRSRASTCCPARTAARNGRRRRTRRRRTTCTSWRWTS